MKKIALLTGLFLAIVFGSNAQTTETPAENLGEIEFEKISQEFGDIKQGQVVNATFKFKNKGKSPVILSNVQTTCGCTVPQWTRDPIAPGKTAEINATFNSSGKMGQQNKVITVFSNAKNSQTQVSIVCNVVPADAPAAPNPTAAPKN
ncbi:MAG: DUF1573 domain-containing protein [Bacteroidetes bacterium]|nr:MAG: DUF1573 domain-containing protein [Bacteroidota bacterium]